jgi:flagellar basal-body rod protein FlgB
MDPIDPTDRADPKFLSSGTVLAPLAGGSTAGGAAGHARSRRCTVAFLNAMAQAVDPLATALSARARRQSAIAANIANADTPGYRAVDVTFRGLLEKAGAGPYLATTHPAHLQAATAAAGGETVQLSGGAPRRDGNDVNVDREMVKLAQNQLEYQFLARALGGKFRKLKEATGRTA